MIKHSGSVACLKIIIEERTKNVNLLDIIDRLTFSVSEDILEDGEIPENKEQIVFGPINIVSFWYRLNDKEEESSLTRVAILKPEEEPKYSPELTLDLIDNSRFKSTIVLRLGIRKPGTYLFNIEQQDKDSKEWNVETSIPIEVVINSIYLDT